MAVAAAIDCLNGLDRKAVDGLIFATTTPPYAEKQAAVTVAAAVDLRKDIVTMDVTDTLRAGTTAMRVALDAIKAGTAKQVLVVAADSRPAQPRSSYEQAGGDGAAALLFGETGVAANVEGSYSITRPIMDTWRGEGDPFVRSWEDRFIAEEGYFKAVRDAVQGLLKEAPVAKTGISKAAYFAPDARRHREMARHLGLAPEQIQDPLFGALGNTGAAFPLMLLVASLEDAKPGDWLLLASYGDGSDAYLLQMTDQIDKIRDRLAIKKHLASKRMVPDYQTYLSCRGLYDPDTGVRRPPQIGPSAPALLREENEVLRLYGAKCKACGTVQYPPQRVCTRCHARDNFEPVRLSDKRATIFTYAMDFIAGTKEVPLVVTVINFEGGGRMIGVMTDRDINEIKVGMPLEMSFRKLYYAEGVHNYFWKCTPVRA